MTEFLCPFCRIHPYEYVDNGVGMEPFAINCCELGQVYFSPQTPPETVEISYGDLERIAEILRAMQTLGMDVALSR